MPDEPPKRKLIPRHKRVNWIYLIWWKRFSPLAIRGEKEIYEWFVLYVTFFWPNFSWNTVCVLGEWERGWKLSPSWNSLYHILAQQDCVGIQLGKASPQKRYGCGVSGLKTSVDMLWKLQGYQPIGSSKTWRTLSSREVAAVLNRKHKGAQ